jgi:hypothetical protein
MKLNALLVFNVLLCTVDLFSQKMGDAYALNINNIYFPLNRKGILADVNIPPLGSGGQFGGNVFLFSGGFFLSGYSNGSLWANAVASASLVEDYIPSTVSNPNNPYAQLYKLRSDDPPFGLSWQDWSDAVNLGANFYDGDGDGIYVPEDKIGPNGEPLNGQWDSWEDRPDLLGDETIWCVFHDGVPAVQRRWNTVEPQGIEVRQTVFAYTAEQFQALKNVIFIRYRLTYTGLGIPNEPERIDSAYFGIWDDPDIGESQDDLVGSDPAFGAVYSYNNGPDNIYGQNPPSFFAGIFSGPRTYIPGETFIDYNGNGEYDDGIDLSLDTAYSMRGQLLGITRYPGARNLYPSTNIAYINGVPDLLDPNTNYEARNYMLGLTRLGDELDPCIWSYGEVRGGIDCNTVDPKYWYSGNPVTNTGWINTYEGDQRQLINVGPFKLRKNEENEIFIVYVVGQSSNALTAIDDAKDRSNIARWLFHLNFDTTYVVSVEDPLDDGQPNEFFLYQNYPNPFNPSTKISWQVPVGSWQTLKIYDVLGNEVATLVDENKPAGNYEVEWNSDNYPSGVYFYQLKTENFLETKKMILIK